MYPPQNSGTPLGKLPAFFPLELRLDWHFAGSDFDFGL
jgi:hypothetical protein